MLDIRVRCLFFVGQQQFWVDLPPTIGEMKGPIKTRAEKAAIAIPLVSFPNMSAKAPPTTARGQEAKTPAKKRHSMRVWKSFAVAQANMKQVYIVWQLVVRQPLLSSLVLEELTNTKQEAVIGIFLPYISERGAHAKGPVAKPQM